MSQTDNVKTRERFPTFRRVFARFGKLPFVSRAWWKRNFRRVAFVGLFLVFTWTAANIYATFALNREIAAIKQRGEPLTMADLTTPVAPSQNAAMVYEKAFKLLRYEEHENNAMQGFDSDNKILTPPQKFAAQERIFSRNRATTQLIFQAVKRPKNYLKLDFSKPASTERAFASWAYMREFARFMSAQAEYEANRGNRAQAFRCLDAISRMSEHVAQDQNTLGMLVAIAMERIGHAGLARVLDIAPLSPLEAQRIAALLPHGDLNRSLQRVLWNERIYALSYFQGSNLGWKLLRTSQDSNEVQAPLSFGERVGFSLSSPLRKLDGVTYLRLLGTQNANIPVYAPVTRIILPPFDKVRSSIAVTQDTREMARIALALKLWKQTHSSYPKSLQELKSIPIESLPKALARKTIGYKTQGDKFLLYSFGLNRRDDGGKSHNYDPLNPSSRAFKEDDDDLAWRQSLGVRKQSN